MGGKYAFSLDELKELAQSFDITKLDTFEKNERTRVNAQKRQGELFKQKEALLPLAKLSGIVSEYLDTRHALQRVVSVPPKKAWALLEQVEKGQGFAKGSVLTQDKRNALCHIIADKKFSEEIDTLLQNFGASVYDLASLDPSKSFGELVKDIENEIKEQDKIITKTDATNKDLSSAYMPALATHELYHFELDAMRAKQRLGVSEFTFRIKGYIDKKDKEALMKNLKEKNTHTEIKTLSVGKDEKLPVKLNNPPWVKPIEGVTKLYGLPNHKEVDPTPFIMPSFLLFFALCLTDAIYGIFTFVATGLLLLFKRNTLSPSVKSLVTLLFYGGAITTVAGVLYTGWLGLSPDTMPAWMQNMALSLAILDPLTAPVAVLVVSLILGYLHMMIGTGIKMYLQLKEKAYTDAFFESFAWLYMLTGLLLYIAARFQFLLPVYEAPLMYVTISGVVLLFIAGMRGKPWYLMIPSGFLNLYGLVGFGSDVLSYSRLLALGLATSIIALAVNQIAMLPITQANGEINLISFGIIFTVIILIVGHIFNLGLNMLGAYIHSARLQFVEFFSKFMEGGGRAFEPLSYQGHYCIVLDAKSRKPKAEKR